MHVWLRYAAVETSHGGPGSYAWSFLVQVDNQIEVVCLFENPLPFCFSPFTRIHDVRLFSHSWSEMVNHFYFTDVSPLAFFYCFFFLALKMRFKILCPLERQPHSQTQCDVYQGTVGCVTSCLLGSTIELAWNTGLRIAVD